MRVVFLSTVLTPHQIPFCDSMQKIADEFYFIQTDFKAASWEAKGQRIYACVYDYLHFFYEERSFCDEKLLDADVVIIGGVDLSLVRERLKQGKLVFVFLERFYKNGITFKNIVRVVGGTFIHHGRFQRYKPYLLCASGYCAGDAAIFGNYRHRTLKWGYFPENKIVDLALLLNGKKENTIIWVGRLIDWKHPDDMLQAAKQLKQMGYQFQLKMYGDGEMKDDLQLLIEQYDLGAYVSLGGDVPNKVIRQEMDQASIFVSTSDYGEGWGCVINEAMNSACAVVVSHAAGATPFLIRHGENGVIYHSGDVDELTARCAELLASPHLCRSMGKHAYKTISTEWNAQTAAERLISTSHRIIAEQKDPFEEKGLCSYAEPIQQKNMYTRMKNVGRKEENTCGNDTFSQ